MAAVDGNGSSALLLACLEGQLEAAELLVEEAKVGWFGFFLASIIVSGLLTRRGWVFNGGTHTAFGVCAQHSTNPNPHLY